VDEQKRPGIRRGAFLLADPLPLKIICAGSLFAFTIHRLAKCTDSGKPFPSQQPTRSGRNRPSDRNSDQSSNRYAVNHSDKNPHSGPDRNLDGEPGHREYQAFGISNRRMETASVLETEAVLNYLQ
jgi:hypothetical protein